MSEPPEKSSDFAEPPFTGSESSRKSSNTTLSSREPRTNPSLGSTSLATTGTVQTTDNGQEVVRMKMIRIGNLGCKTNATHLAEFFGLKETPFLERTCSIELQEESGEYSANVHVPENVHTQLLKKDGIEYMGKNLHIFSHDSTPSFAMAATAPGNETEILKKVVELDMTYYFTCYEVKSLTSGMIAEAVAQTFNFDDSKRLLPLSWDKISWKVDTKHPERYEDISTLKHNGRDIGHVSVKVEKQIVRADGKIVTVRRKEKDEILITLQYANTTDFDNVKQEEIYKKIVEMGVGTIKRGLTVQNHQNSEVPNGNVYFVLKGLKPGDLEKLPNFFVFNDKKMFLRWAGKPRNCSFCQKWHNGDCEMEKLVRKMEEERDGVRANNNGNFKIKLFTNSTLRHANQKALACNVDAMSGATTGHLLNALEIDTEAKDIPNIILVAGQSETNDRVRNDEFLWNLKLKTERLHQLAENKTVAILPPPKPTGYMSAEREAREEVWRANLQNVSDENEKIHIWENPIEEYEEDDGMHPSEKQTGELLRYLNEKSAQTFGEPLILSSATAELLCMSRKYRGVNGLYRYGCAACQRKERNRWPGLCDECKNDVHDNGALHQEVAALEERIRQFNVILHPSLTDSDGEQISCDDCGIPLDNGIAIKEHFKVHHSTKDSTRGSDDIRSNSKFNSDKGRRGLTKNIPEKSL